MPYFTPEHPIAGETIVLARLAPYEPSFGLPQHALSSRLAFVLMSARLAKRNMCAEPICAETIH